MISKKRLPKEEKKLGGAKEPKAPKAKAEPKAKKEKAPKKSKVAKAVKPAKVAKAVKNANKPDCKELLSAWEGRKKAAKESAGKKTAPVMKRAAETMGNIVKAGVAYNKKQGGDLQIKQLKDAVKAMVDALDAFKDALKGKLEDTYIDKFKSDMKEILKAAEEASEGK